MPDVVSSAAFYAEITKLHETINDRFDSLDTKLLQRIDTNDRDRQLLANRVLVIEEAKKSEDKYDTAKYNHTGRRITLVSSFTSATVAVLLWLINTFLLHK